MRYRFPPDLIRPKAPSTSAHRRASAFDKREEEELIRKAIDEAADDPTGPGWKHFQNLKEKQAKRDRIKRATNKRNKGKKVKPDFRTEKKRIIRIKKP